MDALGRTLEAMRAGEVDVIGMSHGGVVALVFALQNPQRVRTLTLIHPYYTSRMAMGRRKDRGRTPGLWIATSDLPPTGGHPFYQRLNRVLEDHAFDDFVEAQCAPFYAATRGRPSLTPGTYFRLLLIGYFEGIDAERGIAWRRADSLALRGFLGLGLDEEPPEHSTISRTRRLIDLETHRAVFTWILQVLATADLVKGQTIGIDATTLEANAAISGGIVRYANTERDLSGVL